MSSLAGLPVRLYRDGKFAGLHHHTKFKPDLAIWEEARIFANSGNVSYYMDENFLYYGLFRTEGGAVSLIIGPVAQSPVDHTLAVRVLRSMGKNIGRAGSWRNRCFPAWSMGGYQIEEMYRQPITGRAPWRRTPCGSRKTW